MKTNKRTRARAILLSGLLLTFSGNAFSQSVDAATAKRIASKYVSNPTLAADGKSMAKKAFAGGESITTSNPPYYIFNDANGNGFAIVSGDSRMGEVIGYSDTGHIDTDNLSEPLQELLQAKAATMAAIEVDSVDVLPHYPNRPKTFVRPLAKTTWNQGQPYNLYTPTDYSGWHTYTGCVPTATVQVMNFHKWPKERPNGLRDCNGLSYYDWDNMCDSYAGVTDSTKIKAVATLMYDVGRSERAVYTTTGGTSSDEGKAWHALENIYGYSTRLLYENLFTGNTYLEAIYNEISDGYPVLCVGGDHSFFYDGYDENGLIHCNWGWGGDGDGYFDILTVKQSGNSLTNGNYWVDQKAIFAHPKDGKHKVFDEQPITLSVTDNHALTIKEEAAARTGKLTAELITVGARNLAQGTSGAYTGNVGIGLFTADGTCVHIFNSPYGDESLTWDTYYTFFGFNNSTKPWQLDFSEVDGLANGNYTLRPLGHRLLNAKTHDWESWMLMLNGNRVPITVTDDSIKVIPTDRGPRLRLAGKPDLLVPVYTNGSVNGAVAVEIANPTRYEARGEVTAVFHGTGNLQGKTYKLPDGIGSGTKVIPRLGSKKLVIPICSSYSNSDGGFSLEPGKWSMSLYLVKQGGDTLDISLPENFEIDVKQSSDPRIMISNVCLYDGGKETKEKTFTPGSTQTITMGMHTIVKYTKYNSVDATLRYRLIDLTNDSCAYTSGSYSAQLPFTSDGTDADMTSSTRAEIDLTTLKAGHTYEIHVDLWNGTAWEDRWNNTSLRRTFSLAAPADDSGEATAILSPIADKGNKAKPAARYNLNGQRVSDSYKGIVIENGRKYIAK